MTAASVRAFAFGLLALAAAAGAQTQRIVAFGDSLTVGFGDESGRDGYPSRLQELLTTPSVAVSVENRGVSGETTAEGLSRLANLTAVAADWIILMEGTNDAFRDVSTETTVANLVAMVSRARQRGFGEVFLATVPPIGVTSSGPRFGLSIELSHAIRQATYDRSWDNPDPHQGLYDRPNLFDALYNDDGIHPNAAGYQAMAEIFADYIEGFDSLAPVPSLVTPSSGSTGVERDALLEVVVFDPLSGLDATTATLTLDGQPIPTQVTGDPRRAVLRSRPGTLSGKRSLGVDVRDLASPENRRVNVVSIFTVAGTTFVRGDIDRSGRVDGGDLVALGFSFGTGEGESRYRDAADVDNSGRIDGSDLAIVAANFGRSSS